MGYKGQEMTKRMVAFDVSPELLAQVLSMPEPASIVMARWVTHTGCALRLYAEGPEFPEVPEGHEPELVTVDLTVHPRRIEWKWNLPK